MYIRIYNGILNITDLLVKQKQLFHKIKDDIVYYVFLERNFFIIFSSTNFRFRFGEIIVV